MSARGPQLSIFLVEIRCRIAGPAVCLLIGLVGELYDTRRGAVECLGFVELNCGYAVDGWLLLGLKVAFVCRIGLPLFDLKISFPLVLQDLAIEQLFPVLAAEGRAGFIFHGSARPDVQVLLAKS